MAASGVRHGLPSLAAARYGTAALLRRSCAAAEASNSLAHFVSCKFSQRFQRLARPSPASPNTFMAL